jgi:hypothetical protein
MQLGMMFEHPRRLMHALEPVIPDAQGCLIPEVHTFYADGRLKPSQLPMQFFTRGLVISPQD